MKRTIKKAFWVNRKEADDLRRKAESACLTESEFMRQLITGYIPPAKPDERFYRAMDIIREMADAVDEIAMKADGPVNMIAIMTEAKKWRMLQNALEKEFLRPKRSDA